MAIDEGRPKERSVGQLVDGVWQEVENRIDGGRYRRPSTLYRNWVTPDGSPGPSGEGGFPAQAGRYHLYVCLACPWAHRTLIFRALKKLDDAMRRASCQTSTIQ